MKRLMIWLLVLMLPCAALANGWGAPGGTVEIFEGNRDYADYTCIADDYSRDEDTARLIMSERYHRQLICAEQADGHWRIAETSTTALYQPGNEKADKARVDRIPEGFALFYPDEEYRFAYENGEWALYWAQVDGLIFSREAAGELTVFDGSTTVIWQMGALGEENAALTLDRFNIELFPRSVMEVRRLNELRAVIADGGEMLWEPVTEAADRLLPVYSAPSEKSWRAAEGKAAVSLKDTEGLYTYGEVDGWQLIAYKVSPRMSRIGYIQAEDEPRNGAFFPMDVRAARETYLTDDPGVSQIHEMTVPVGTELTALDCYGLFYAYVEMKLDGQAVRGFVPLRDLWLGSGYVASTMRDALVGAWRGPGVQFAENYIALGEGGTFATYEEIDGRLMERGQGSWEVRICAPERFTNEANFMLILSYENGRALCAGVAVDNSVAELCTEASFEWTRVPPETWETEWDVMAKVAGSYEIFSGGSMLAGDRFTLNADGTMVTHDEPAYTGTWAVTRYNPAEGVIWDHPAYTVTFALDNGYTCRLGMTYGVEESTRYAGNQSLTLTDGEGAGGYIRTDIDMERMMEIAGNYAFAEGGGLLPQGQLRLHEDGYFFSEGLPEGAMHGIWSLMSCEAELFGRPADFEINFDVLASSPVRPGERLRFGGTFTPATVDSPAILTIFNEEDSMSFRWEEEAGNG